MKFSCIILVDEVVVGKSPLSSKVKTTFPEEEMLNTGFIRVLENLESPGILL